MKVYSQLSEFPLLKHTNIFHYKTGDSILHVRARQEFIDCKIIIVPGKYDSKPYAIGYQKNSPYAEMLDYHIEKLRQIGVLDRIQNKYRSSPQQCPDVR